jgi:hypothetical protein
LVALELIYLAAFDSLIGDATFLHFIFLHAGDAGHMNMSQYLTWERPKAQLQLLSVPFSYGKCPWVTRRTHEDLQSQIINPSRESEPLI